ncbi:peptidase S41 [Flavobacteriaceae bacterium R38]|nr:peptidase S41 [Flavobacteriaceae bacterium R38]
MRKILFLLTIISLINIGCSDRDDDLRAVPASLEINDFVWRGMNFFYLYKDDVPNLADNRFPTDEEYLPFLEGFDTPEALFNSLLFLPGDEDEFSFITDNRFELEDFLGGTSLNSGVEFGLVRFPGGGSNLFGIVRYIIPGSEAENSTLQRGDIFTTVNGTQLTDANFGGLLFNDDTSVTYGLATFDGVNVTPTGEEVTVGKTTITENPILIADVLNVGSQNVGYLVYNGFRADFDEQLNDVFGTFAANNVTDLILDLRYNGGGSVTSSITLGSLITGQFSEEVFSTERWNSDLQAFFEANNPDRLVNLFQTTTRNGTPLNHLNLNRVFVLTTGSSASASELTINSLSSYIDVIQIGTQTRGKFQASITVFDSEVINGESNFNDFDDRGITTSHNYAMQPLVLIEVNADGVSEFAQGLDPDLELREDFTNFGILGNPSEPLLARAIQEITGATNTSIRQQRISSFPLEEIQYKKSEMFKDNMTLHLKDFQ